MMDSLEHMLMVTMFARQQQTIRALVTCLQSYGIALPDDLVIFAAANEFDRDVGQGLLADAKRVYLQDAKQLGIQTGLENLP